jgi:hypothetical protein
MGDDLRLGASTTAAAADSFSVRAKQVFDRVDTDDDGFLSKSELSDALHSRSYTGHDAAAVAVLFENRRDLEELSNDEWGDENDGITKADLAAFDTLSRDEQRDLANYDYAMAQGPIDRADYRLFPEGLASIKPSAVEQGNYGVCYFLSAVAGLASSNPKAIRDMISEDGNGTYTVRFPGRDPVQVTLTDGELVKASATKDGAWVAVLEQAYMDHVDPLAEMGGLTGGIKALTGKGADTYIAVKPFSLDSIREPLKQAQAEGRLVVASRTWSSNGDLPSQHVYGILGYDAATDRVRIRNPHGSETTLTTAEFRDQFDFVAIQQR